MDFTEAEVTVLRYLLYPYRVMLVADTDHADVMICKGLEQKPSKPAIRMIGRSPQPCSYQEPKDHCNGIIDMPLELITEALTKFKKILIPNIALKYKLVTQLPFQYNFVPSWIRSRLLKMQEIDSDLSRHLGNEIARSSLVRAFRALGFPLERKRPPLLLVTHDIESPHGLAKATLLKSVEDDLDMASTWFVPSDEYPIRRDIARELSSDGRIGSHDIKHDGKLIHIKTRERLVDRLRSSRLRLERIFDKEVECFRSPLLQFSQRIGLALGDAGYRFDFSVPCWEPVHPVSMGGFGVESTQAFEIGGVIEFPLTLIQDHQVMNVMGMTTREAIKFWIKEAELICSFDGDLVLCVHPDYAFSQDLKMYRALLTSLSQVRRTDNPEDKRSNEPEALC